MPTAPPTPSPTSSATPTPTPTPTPFTSTVLGWGANSVAQLGDGTTAPRTSPAPAMQGPTHVVAVTGGSFDHTLVLTSDGTVWAAGKNSVGQLGDGTTTDRTTPVQVSGLANVVAIAASQSQSYALKTDGTVWAWGSASVGALGNGATSNSSVPVQVCITVSAPGTCATPLTNVSAIAAGRSSTAFALVNDGTLRGWGDGSGGRLGYGGTGIRSTATQVCTSFEVLGTCLTRLSGVVAVAAGDSHTLALLGDGTVRAWGHNDSGQIGDGTISGTPRTLPVTVCQTAGSPGFCSTALTGVAAIGVGDAHSLAVKTDGSVVGWGNGGSGQLGDGSFSSTPRTLPVAVGTFTSAIAVGGGDTHSLILTSGGTVWGTGYDGSGGLGDGTTTSRNTVVQSLGITSAFTIAAVGDTSFAIEHSGAALPQSITFSALVDKQLGDADFTIFASASSALPVSFNAAGSCTLSGVSVHLTGRGSCTITASQAGGGVWQAAGDVARTFAVSTNILSWGRNDRGQLGTGNTTDSSSPVNSLIGRLVAIAADSTGSRTVAIRSDGTVWGWGRNDHGQLGDNTTTDRSSPTQPLNGFNAVAVAAGNGFTLALTSDGEVWGWGLNNLGQLANDTTADSHVPVQVGGGVLTNVVAIAAGSAHGLALKRDGTVWAWGSNSDGQLGNGTTSPFAQTGVNQVCATNSTAPSCATVLQNVTALAAGQLHSVALKNDGTLSAWGNNSSGQLGDGTTSQHTLPVQVPVSSLAGVTAVAAGNFQTLAVKSNGTAWAWGKNTTGALGNGATTTSPNATPVQVNTLSNVVAVAAGSGHSLAFETDGTVWAWGDNTFGQLGNGTTSPTPQTTPIQVGAVTNTVATAAGGTFSVVLRAIASPPPALLATVAVGTNPIGVASDPMTGRTYVADRGTNDVKVIDSTTNALVTTIGVGSSPFGVAVNPERNLVYVTDQNSGSVTVIDGATNSVIATIAVGSSPSGIAVDPITGRVYVANFGGSSLSVIDGTSNSVMATVAVGSSPRYVATDPLTGRAYVGNVNSNSVSVIDGSNSVIATVSVGSSPFGVAVDPLRNHVFVANRSSNTVSVIDGASNSVIATVAVGTNPEGIAVNARWGRVYVADFTGSQLSVINDATNVVTTTLAIAGGTGPQDVAVDPATGRVYLTGFDSATLNVIDGTQLLQ